MMAICNLQKSRPADVDFDAFFQNQSSKSNKYILLFKKIVNFAALQNQ